MNWTGTIYFIGVAFLLGRCYQDIGTTIPASVMDHSDFVFMTLLFTLTFICGYGSACEYYDKKEKK